MSTTRLENSKVKFSVLIKDDTEFLICISTTGNQNIRYVENLKTGKRAFPTKEQIESVSDTSTLVPAIDLDELMGVLINEVN